MVLPKMQLVRQEENLVQEHEHEQEQEQEKLGLIQLPSQIKRASRHVPLINILDQ